MIAKFACVAAILTVAYLWQAKAGGVVGGIQSGHINKGGAPVVGSPSIDLGVSGILSNNGILNGNKTGILNGVLNGNKTSVDVIDNKNDGGKKRRH